MMGRPNIWLRMILLLGLVGAGSCVAVGQQDVTSASVADTSTLSAVAVVGQPFSALEYRRRVKLLPDDKQRILSEINVMALARDADGRVWLKTAVDSVECEHLGAQALRNCPCANVILFEPLARTITHWPEGEIAAHGAVVIVMSAGQMEDVENSTMTLSEYVSDFDPAEAKITTENLGSRVMEGVTVTGVRTTAVLPAGYSGNPAPVTRIHEVWTSESMRLVIRVIDGDPNGLVTISGLEQVSRNPDPALFHPPYGYRFDSSDRSEFVDFDITLLGEWLVK